MSIVLVRHLQQNKLLSEDELLIAAEEQRSSGECLEQCLLHLGLLAEMDLAACIAVVHGVEVIDLERATPAPEALAMVPAELARRHQLLPIYCDEDAGTLEIAISDPGNLVALDEVSALLATGLHLLVRVAGRERLAQALDLYYGKRDKLAACAHKLAAGGDADTGVVSFIEALFADAVRQRASDLHLEPERGFVRVRYRVDGVMQVMLCVHKKHWAALVVRLKILAGLDIAEQRRPQDGRISATVAGREVDVRISTLPAVHGENIVMRLLDSERGIVSFSRMGINERHVAELEQLLLRPDGVMFVTGPTGSGKTTTLYTIIDKLNKADVNIMTLEDPVEYQLPMVRQCALGSAAQFDFAEGTRALLRQDPDIILIGEVRDEQTARMAMRAAMSGHLVLATLHCGHAPGAVPRLLDMGISPVLLESCINGVIAQRLVRRLCNNCRSPRPATAEERILFAEQTPVLYEAVGCSQCNSAGYTGRITLMELWQPQPGQCEALGNGSLSPHSIHTAADFMTLAECGLEIVRQGATTMAELRRVVYVDG